MDARSSTGGPSEVRETEPVRSPVPVEELREEERCNIPSFDLHSNVEFQKLELNWSARKSNKAVFLSLSPQFLDLVVASTMLLGFINC
jgi:hypothetical protein